MVIDTSALVAILLQEREAERISKVLETDPLRFLSAANWFEAQMILNSRRGAAGGVDLAWLLRDLRVEIIAFDSAHVQAAFAAWHRYGKGRHQAALNMGDCCAYATASLKNQPLLFKGNDFLETDLRRVEY